MKRDTLIISLLFFFFIAAVGISFVNIGQGKRSGSSVKKGFILPKNGIAVMNIYGEISTVSSSQFLGPAGVDGMIQLLYEVEENSRIRALVLRINSPGGTVGASQEFYREIIKLKERTHIPVIVSIADVAASGGYWIALAGDTIFANPGSMVGNIGVIIGGYDLSEVPDRYGIDFKLYKSAPYKDLMNTWRKSSKNEDHIMQSLIDNVHQQFEDVFAQSRGLNPKAAKLLADGRVYTGKQAYEKHMIDQLGGLNDAILFAKKVAGIKGDHEIISLSRPSISHFLNFWKGQLGSRFGFPSSQLMMR